MSALRHQMGGKERQKKRKAERKRKKKKTTLQIIQTLVDSREQKPGVEKSIDT